MLVVMHDGNVERLLQPFLDIETLRGLDVLQVDASKGRGNALHGLTEFLGIFFVDLDVKDINASIYLEEQSLTLHDGFAAHGTDVTQSQDGSAVGDDSYQIAFVGILVRIIGIVLNLQTGIGHTRRVSQRKVGLCTVSFGWFYFDFSWTTSLMILQG